jgi:hypothetical protein
MCDPPDAGSESGGDRRDVSRPIGHQALGRKCGAAVEDLIVC